MRALLLALVLPAACAGAAPALTDDSLAALAAKPFDKAAKMGRREVLGSLGGAAVVADYPCSDICPQYTVRLIHYDLEPGAACDKVGGVTMSLTVPMGIAVTRKDFCIPRVLADRKLQG